MGDYSLAETKRLGKAWMAAERRLMALHEDLPVNIDEHERLAAEAKAAKEAYFAEVHRWAAGGGRA